MATSSTKNQWARNLLSAPGDIASIAKSKIQEFKANRSKSKADSFLADKKSRELIKASPKGKEEAAERYASNRAQLMKSFKKGQYGEALAEQKKLIEGIKKRTYHK